MMPLLWWDDCSEMIFIGAYENYYDGLDDCDGLSTMMPIAMVLILLCIHRMVNTAQR